MMLMEKEDLALNLSLGFAQTHHPLQLNLKPSASMLSLQKLPWNQTFASSSDHQNPPFLRGIDVNSLPATADCEEEPGVSSPNSTISSIVSGKRSERDGNAAGDDHETTAERACSRGGTSDEEDGGETSRKKLRLSKDQSAVLEETFKEHNTLNPKQKLALAKRLGLTPRQVEVWFQNRRARTKLKQTEVDCEYLRRCVETLTEENRRLQKEVAELRALKLSPQLYAGMTPPTTLIMCPSCERVAGPPSNTSPSCQAHQIDAGRAYHHNHHHHHHRAVPVNPWLPGSGPMAHGPALEVLRPRS